MKDQLKRGLSAVLVLVMLISLLSGLILGVRAETYIPEETVAAEPAEGSIAPTEATEPEENTTEPSEAATEPTGSATEPTAAETEPYIEATEGADGAAVDAEETTPATEAAEGASASYSFNTGTRGAVCTSLPTAATSFYNRNGVTYEDLAELSGSSSTSSVSSSALYKRLQKLMKDNHDHITNYDETRSLYQYTDCQNGGGKISSFYSGTSIGPAWDGGGTWNREHVWPNSKGLGGNDENDIMMLRPTSKNENSTRGNRAYGESSNYYHPNSESGGSYDVRGDVARIFLYIYVRWGNVNGNGEYATWGSNGVMESKSVLLKWMKADPVDTWEMSRNNVVQEITGTRNVFVDYPELAFVLFDEAIPADMTTPSGNAGKTYEITVTVNDASMGSATLSGNNINATPATGYMVAGYEVVSGTATVKRTGNAFTVSASSDCTIQINFAAREQVDIVYMNDTTKISETTAYSGDTITLPAFSGTTPANYTFVGWSVTAVSHEDEMPAYTESGKTYTVTGDTTFRALFSYTAAGEGGTGIWTLVNSTAELSAGSQIVLAENSTGVLAAPLNGQILLDVEATFSADKKTIPTMPSGAQIFTLRGSTGAWTLENANGEALGAFEAKKLSYTKGNSTWKITVTDGSATVANTETSYGKFFYNSGAPRFTTYVSSFTGSILPQIYMLKDGKTTYYTTATCSHEDTTDVPAEPATCTEGGYTAGVYCNDCKTYISGHEPTASNGHNYGSVVTPPTTTEQGYTTYTCPACGDSYVDDYVPALGEGVAVSFSVPAGVAKVADMTCTTAGITLPEAGVPEGGYTFLGWIEEMVDHSTTEPSGYYKAGDKFTTDEETTLRALYRLTEGGDGTESFLLVEDVNQLYAGAKVVIAATGEDVALSTTDRGNNRAQASIEKDGKTITFGSDVAVLDLGEGNKTGTWSFYCPTGGVGYLYAASSSSNNLKTKATLDDNGSFAISIKGGVATIKAQGDKTRNWIRHNPGNDIFSCYLNTQNDVSLYIKTVSGTVTYTTEIEQETGHTHAGTFHEAEPATCTQNGTVAYYECTCGEKFADEDCTEKLTSIVDPKKGHDFSAKVSEGMYLKSKANCQESAVYYVSCSRCGVTSKDTDQEKTFTKGDVDITNHNTNQTFLLNKKDATCTEDGYSGDVHCAGCSTKISSGDVIPAGHNLEPVAKKDATHKSVGMKAHYECARCGKLFLDEQAEEEVEMEDLIIAKIQHTFGDYKSDKTNHWKECSCGEKSSKGAHTYGSWKTVKSATKTAKGEKQRTCTVCDYTQTQSIPMVSSPSTGDNRPIGFYLAMMALSFFSLCCTVVFWPRRGKYSR